ncbi:DUF3363 domain-containing protein [Asticcacaulis sp. DW145]|uniref:relaxase/mobilization nuclease RlxS n=1 Tax=Asticcacaulis sp. DW145 TaxID=3095608 RepID=UPI00309128A6|nr:DUF3363 domain-containing protein [Asticcacaulis sp. DW145]
MTPEDPFEPKLGRMRAQPTKLPKSFRSKVLGAVQRAGGFNRYGKGGLKSAGNYGRGAGAGRVLAADASRGPTTRRVVVKARFVRLAGKGLRAATAHLKYLQRDGVTREGARGVLYGLDADRIEASDFMKRCDGDRHQFRFIVAPEDGQVYEDLKPLTRKVMQQMEADLKTKLDWAAVDHFNTGHPHTHIVLRGRDDRGKDLVIAREYMSEGFRERVQAQVSLDLGPRSEREIIRGLQAEVHQERLTSLDRQLAREANTDRQVQADHRDPVLNAARAGRLVKLEALGLAEKAGPGRWSLSPDMEATLRQMGERGDIIKGIHQTLKEKGLEAAAPEAQIHGPAGVGDVVTGRLIECGLSDEASDRHYALVEGTDGRVHYVDLGHGDLLDALPELAIVRLTPKVPEVRTVDRTIADVAAANGGIYTVDLHLKHDPAARQTFAETHARRLEAIRKAQGGIERLPDGRFQVGADYLQKALAYERRDVQRAPVMVEVLSTQSLTAQARHPGVTWLDRQLVQAQPAGKGAAGFGCEVRDAMRLRQQWLVEEGLLPGLDTAPSKGTLATLHKRELHSTAETLVASTGKTWREVRQGETVAGKLRERVTLGAGQFAVVERAKDFALVPWRPVLKKHIGKEVSGVLRESGINWSLGRGQGRDIV